jgi:hypothetical protein
MERIKNNYQRLLYDFLKYDIEAVCPQCSKKALVKTHDFSFQNIPTTEIKVVCSSCGYNKWWSEKPANNSITIGVSFDPFFQLPLWLLKEWNGNTIWAYNREHLSFIREHIESKLRERNGQAMMNKSIGSRLPRWMTSKKNREVMLRLLEELKEKAG